MLISVVSWQLWKKVEAILANTMCAREVLMWFTKKAPPTKEPNAKIRVRILPVLEQSLHSFSLTYWSVLQTVVTNSQSEELVEPVARVV